ncbi:MAG: helix-turn-helix domain-containing protein [Brevibacterium sp.]|nr:helix-turn-helix domain-containing protein [Brevibacterium sp.]
MRRLRDVAHDGEGQFVQLCDEPCTTGEVCAAFADLDRTTVLQHIRVLERAELLGGRRIGRTRQLALAPLPIKRIHDPVDRRVHAGRCGAPGRFGRSGNRLMMSDAGSA